MTRTRANACARGSSPVPSVAECYRCEATFSEGGSSDDTGPLCPHCSDVLWFHEKERHVTRAEDGDAAPVMGCPWCEEAFPAYFAEAAQFKREYDARPYHDDSDHERGHPERPEIAWQERMQ